MGRPEAGARPVADPAVEGHAQDGHVGLDPHLVEARQPGEGGLPGVAGYRVASTGPTVSPVTIRGTDSVMSLSTLGCLRVRLAWLGGGCCLLRVRMAVLGEDRGLGNDVDRL